MMMMAYIDCFGGGGGGVVVVVWPDVCLNFNEKRCVVFQHTLTCFRS